VLVSVGEKGPIFPSCIPNVATFGEKSFLIVGKILRTVGLTGVVEEGGSPVIWFASFASSVESFERATPSSQEH
jgi:hypothetical protein